jgi:ribosomal protein S12 methylthiotransferase accessory factor
VNADATIPRPNGAGCFLHTTNGLASGNSEDEAVLHGLCEVIERDALAIWECSADVVQTARRIDLESIKTSPASDVVQQLLAADILPIIWDTTSDVGIATFRVALYDCMSDPVARPLPTGLGAGCHPDRIVAVCRALTEAAQSRLTAIAGSRDDLGRPRYRMTQSAEALNSFRALAGAAGQNEFTSVPTVVFESVTQTLEFVVTKLERTGFRQILTVDLSRPEAPISVTRVIVPGLEGPRDSPSYLPGSRALAHVRTLS